MLALLPLLLTPYTSLRVTFDRRVVNVDQKGLPWDHGRNFKTPVSTP